MKKLLLDTTRIRQANKKDRNQRSNNQTQDTNNDDLNVSKLILKV